MECRYYFDLTCRRVWKDMFRCKWFWNMFSVKQTLKYMALDTLRIKE